MVSTTNCGPNRLKIHAAPGPYVQGAPSLRRLAPRQHRCRWLILERRHDARRARLIRRARTLLVCGIQDGGQQGVVILVFFVRDSRWRGVWGLFVSRGFVVLIAFGAVGLEVGVGVVVILFGEGDAPTAAVGKRRTGWGRTGVVMVMSESRGSSEECV